eukprot:1177131-Prorocentrum_minimum.AAC.2
MRWLKKVSTVNHTVTVASPSRGDVWGRPCKGAQRAYALVPFFNFASRRSPGMKPAKSISSRCVPGDSAKLASPRARVPGDVV